MPRAPARGRGRGKAPSESGDAGARFERISLLQLELAQAVTGDGAESALMSESEASPKRGRERSTAREGGEEGGEEGEHEVDYYEEEEEESDGDEPVRKKQASDWQPRAAPAAMAAAAFGGRARYAESAASDVESSVSKTSSGKRKDAYRSAFPLKGVRCVGCSLASRIQPVERFVNENVGRMSEAALWKSASLVWRREVAEPAEREGVPFVDWPWKDVANHFRLHTTNQVIGRTSMIQSLTAMRCQVEQSLIRVENGERTLDKANADLFLKIVAADSRERQLLAAGQGAGRGRGGRAAEE